MYTDYWLKRKANLDILLKKSGVDYVSINTSEDYVKSLVALFKKENINYEVIPIEI